MVCLGCGFFIVVVVLFCVCLFFIVCVCVCVFWGGGVCVWLLFFVVF